MAVSIPREIYTLGAVKLDTTPLARLQGQLQAKKAAQEEALDKYLFDLQGKLPKDQVRAIDRNPFQQKVQNWISKGTALRKQKDKFGAQQEILSGFQELMADANESKAASERQQKIAELKLQGKLDAKDFPIIDKMSRSIYDVDFYKKPEIKQPYTIEDFSANVPTWDLGKRKQFIDFALSGTTPAGKENLKTIEDKENLTQTTTYDKVFTPEQKKDISKKALAILSDESGIKTYEEILKEGASATPTKQFVDLVAAYNSVFPNDLMNSPEKVAAADIILNMSGVRMPGTPVTTPLFKKREQFKGALIEGRQKKEGVGVNLLDYDVLGKYNPQVVTIVKPGATAEEREAIPTEVVFERDIPSEDLELITNKGEVGAITEKGMKPYFKIRSDGNWEGSQGKVIDRSLVARSNLDKTSLAEERRLRQGLIKTTAPKVPATTKKKGELD